MSRDHTETAGRFLSARSDRCRHAFGASWLAALATGLLLLAGGPGAHPVGADEQAAPSTGWAQVDVGNLHTCAVKRSGRLYCWGADGFSQLGNGGSNTDAALPVQVQGGATDWASVSAGGNHTCALKTSGRLFCWGGNAYGQVGDGTRTARSTPVPVGTATNWATVSAGTYHTCARKDTGRILCWGQDARGQLGNGAPRTSELRPVGVAGTGWRTVTAGGEHTCALKLSGRLYCWGFNTSRQLGTGTSSQDEPSPVAVGTATDWAAVSTGYFHTCGRRSGGTIFCWGQNANGEVGTGGGPGTVPTPTRVGASLRWANVNAGSDHTCGRTTAHRLYCWGMDRYGAVGNDASLSPRVATPSLVAGGATDWTSPAVDGWHSCARRSNDTIWCWGSDSYGQIGNGGTVRVGDLSAVPAPVAG
ncbi:MAG: hypothetical protein JNK12_16355 [Acidimicrobiales bacterium]|nr:hypothetical protein [Acidimicrobiales bacterium]